VAIQFAKAHARAIAICARTTSELEKVRKEINEISPDTAVHLQQVDVKDEQAVKSLFETVKQKFGAVDVVVSNAGAQREMSLISQSNADTWWEDFVGGCPPDVRDHLLTASSSDDQRQRSLPYLEVLCACNR